MDGQGNVMFYQVQPVEVTHAPGTICRWSALSCTKYVWYCGHRITSPAFRKLKSFFKNIFIGLKHLELRKRKIADVIPCAGYYEFKKDSDANDMTVQQYYRKMYNIHIK